MNLLFSDGLIDDVTIVEVKCPYSARNDVISESESITFLERDSSGHLKLKKSHNYFYQIQGQLAIAKKNLCLLIVYTFKDLQVFPVEYDSHFVESELIPNLSNFFDKVYLPFLISKLWSLCFHLSPILQIILLEIKILSKMMWSVWNKT